MSHLIRINRGEKLGKERVKMNHMLSYLYDKVTSHETRIAELESDMSQLIDILKDTQADLKAAQDVTNLHLEKITGEKFTEEDIED